MSSHSSKSKRWYDRQADVRKLIEGLSLLPNDIVTVLSECLLEIAENQYHAEEYLKNHRSLGVERVLSLYKSKRKTRKLDQNPYSHKFTNYLFVLPDKERVAIARQVNPLISGVFDYLRLCLENQADPMMPHIKLMTMRFTQEGAEALEAALKDLGRELSRMSVAIPRRNIKVEKALASPELSKAYPVQDASDSLKLSSHKHPALGARINVDEPLVH